MKTGTVVWTRIGLGGVHCPSCASTLAEALSQVVGVRWARVHPVTGVVTLAHDPDVAPLARLVEVLRAAGFAAVHDEA